MNSKVSIITGRVLSTIIVLFMFFDAFGKIAKVEPVMKACAEMQQPGNTIVPIGITLAVCTIIYAIPQTAVLGAILLTGYLGGAVATHVRLNAPMFKEYLRYIANRRCQQIGLDVMFEGATNSFPWMSEMIDLKKERNFFETRVIEYQTGGALSWD